MSDANDSFKTGGVDVGTGTGVGAGAGVDAVDRISPMSGFPHGGTVSCCEVPSRGRDDVAVGGMYCGAATAPDSDECMGYGPM